MHLKKTILTRLTLALVLVYWGLAMPFSFIYLNYDQVQGRWMAIDYLWETPLLAIMLVFLPISYRLTPILDFLESPNPTQAHAHRCRILAQDLPVQAFRPIVLTSVLGYTLASAHLRAVAAFPVEEVFKNAVLGLPTGILYGLSVYFILASALRPAVELCERIVPEAPRRHPRVSLFWKTWACFLVIGLIPITVLGLMSYTFNQRQLEDSLAALNLDRLENFAHKIRSDRHWRLADLFPDSEIVGIANPPGRLTVVKGPEDGAYLLEDLPLFHGPSGSRVVHRYCTRILVWQALSSDRILVASINLGDYNLELDQALQGTLLAAGMTLLISLGLAWVFARHLSKPVYLLTKLAQGVIDDRWPGQLPVCYTDDELGQLGRALRTMLSRLHHTQDELTRANSQLADLLEERTQKMEELKTLYSVSRSVGSKIELDRVFDELTAQVMEMMHADACSIMLVERGGLILKACVGLDFDLHPQWDDVELFRELPRLMTWKGEGTDYPHTLLQEGLNTILTVPMTAHGDLVGLMTIFAKQTAEYSFGQVGLLDRVARQAAVTIENAKLYEERNHVTQLLCSALIPEDDLGFPGLEVAHRYIPSKILSGDYYDLIPLGPRRVGVVMADVAGKGPEAAIQTVRAKNVIRASALAGYSPSRIVTLLNRLINEDGEGKMVTVFYAELDLEAGAMFYCNAGHEPPLLWDSHKLEWRDLESNGVLVGATVPLEYQERKVNLRSGDCLVLFTDGVTEARCPKGEFYGVEPVQAVLQIHAGKHPQVLVDAIYLAVETFTGGGFSDDFSLLALRSLG